MKKIETNIEGLYVLEPEVHKDHRGFFLESYSKSDYEKLGLVSEYVQSNHSFSKLKNTFRGLHYQLNPYSQTTIVKVVSGSILDFAVDIRKESPTYGNYYCTELSEQNCSQMYIPKGFAHGFLTLSDNVHIIYTMDDYYNPELDRIINYRDKFINIEELNDIDNINIANKDLSAPMLKYANNNF